MTRIGEAGILFVIFFLLYMITASGDVIGDTQIRWTVANRIVDTGWVDLPPGTTRLYSRGQDGKHYSFYGVGQSICFLPFVLAGRWLTAVDMLSNQNPDQLGQFLVSLLFFPACGALVVVLVYLIVFDATGARYVARWISIILGLATMHWHHTVNTYEESQIALFILVGLWAIQRGWKSDEWRYPFLALAAMGLAFCFRFSSAVVSAPLGLAGFVYDMRARSTGEAQKGRLVQWIVATGMGLCPFILMMCIFNWIRFGSIFDTGYGEAHIVQLGGIRLFETPIYAGLTGLLFSPGKSVFLYNPILIITIYSAMSFWQSYRRLAMIVFLVVVSTLLFHSKYTFWAGDLAWGPRYLASIMGLWVLVLIPVFQQRRFPRLLFAILGLSIGVQVASIIYNFGLEYFQDRRHGTIPDSYVWRPGESQLFCRFQNIFLHLAGNPNYQSIPPEHERPATHQITTSPESVRRIHAINIFPFKFRAFNPSSSIYYALMGLWLALIIGLCLLICCWIRYIRKLNLQE